MLYRDICRVLSHYLIYLAVLLTIPLGVSLYYEYYLPPEQHLQPHSTKAFIFTIIITLLISAIFRKIGKKSSGKLFRREALALVVFIWFITALIGGLPFYFSKTLNNPVDAYFEAMSGLTTTGASVMHPKNYEEDSQLEKPYFKSIDGPYNNEYFFYGTIEPVRNAEGKIVYSGIEAVGKGLLFWRSFMQWLGGMGIVVLFVAVLPTLGIGSKTLFNTEVPGPIKESLTPRIKETANWLWRLYLAFTILEIILLMVTNRSIDLFEATTITFSTLSTGGFCIKNSSIGYFNNAYTEMVVMIFMLIGSINFALYFYLIKRKFSKLRDPELTTYLKIIFLSSIFVSFMLINSPKILLNGEEGIFNSLDAFRHGFFQVISAQTSTGFATANFNRWPLVCQTLMLIVMFIGGMAGSTGGGIKVIRFYMATKIIYYKIESIFRPDTIKPCDAGRAHISDKMASTVLSFMLIVFMLTALGSFLLILDGVGPETSLSINACMINNIGIAFRMAGPTESFAFLSNFSKIISSIWMVFGRLEVFAVMIIFLPSFWKKY